MSPFTFTVPTDKQPGGWHQAYMEVYARMFAPYRGTAMAVMEIGVDGGGSLVMWKDYFANARVFGVDIFDAPEAISGMGRIQHFKRDAYTIEAVSRIAPLQLDIAIDDCPHTKESQEYFCANYSKILAPGGMLVVEDVQDPSWFPDLHKSLPPEFVSMAVDLRANNGRYDDLMFFAWRK